MRVAGWDDIPAKLPYHGLSEPQETRAPKECVRWAH